MCLKNEYITYNVFKLISIFPTRSKLQFYIISFSVFRLLCFLLSNLISDWTGMNERSILNELDTDNIQPKIKFLKQTIYSYIFKTNKRFQLNFLITSKSLKAEPSSNSSSKQIKDSNLNHISKLSDFLHYIQAKSSADVTLVAACWMFASCALIQHLLRGHICGWFRLDIEKKIREFAYMI